MLWRYIKAQLMVLLCGGLVGPIFLAVYFATGQELTPEVDVLCRSAHHRRRRPDRLGDRQFRREVGGQDAALEQSGVLALAQITGMGETGTRINDQPLVKLQLHIEGPGIAPFDSQDRVIASVTRLGNLTNRKLVVLVDPATQQYQIDWERSALINGLVPATFTSPRTTGPTTSAARPVALMEILQILKANGIGMNNMIDLRSNPAARQQVQAVVRRAAAQQAPAGPPPSGARPRAAPPPLSTTAPPEPSTSQRLAGTGDPARDRCRLRGGVQRQAGSRSSPNSDSRPEPARDLHRRTDRA